jgi:hypothetical protein
MDIKFRSLNEAQRFIDELGLEIADIEQLLDQQQEQVQASVKQLKVLAESFNLVLNDSSNNSVTKLNLSNDKVKVPGGVKNLKTNYALLQELIAKEEALANSETVILLTFKDDPKTKPLLNKIQQLKAKVSKEKEQIIAFLNDIATSTVPPSFNKYVFSVAQSIVDHISLTEDQYDVYYYLTTVDNCLLYSAFIELRDVVNSEGEQINVLYIALHWRVGSDKVEQSMRLSLSYDWSDPVELFNDSRLIVTSVANAVATADKMLEAEDFAVDVGVQPLSKKLKQGIKLNQIDLSALNLQGKIKKLEVEPDEIVVTLNRQPKEQLREVQAQVYLGVQKFFVRGTKLRMSISSNGLTLKFVVTNYTQGKQFSSQDIEYFKSWGLTERQIKKIEVILG